MPSLSERLRQLATTLRGAPADRRGGRIVAVIECILNQNARDRGAASFPAVNERLLRTCVEHRVGIVQIPCPEIHCLGGCRERLPGTSIRSALEDPGPRQACRELAAATADRLAAYQRNGCAVLAILGGNPQSPGCAIHAGAGGLAASSGVFMLELEHALRERGVAIPFRGIRDADTLQEQEDIAWVDRLVGAGTAPGTSAAGGDLG